LSVGDCKYPCNCTLKESCKFGVNMIKDGCDCCLMCARQQGDLCNYRDKCDDEKGLYCDLKLDAGMRGVCRGTLIAKFHYASWFGAGSERARS